MTIIKILNYILCMLQYSKYVNSIVNTKEKERKKKERERESNLK